MLFFPNMIRSAPRTKEQGVTLIELMIASAIGLLIALVVTQAYVNGTAAQRAQSDTTRLQESARFAFFSLSHGLRKAGYRNPKAPGVEFCGANTLRLAGKNDATGLTPTTAGLTGSGVTILSSDVIRVRYFGDGLVSSPFTADGSVIDCLGNSVASNTLVEDTYFIAADTTNDNEPALFCYSSNSSASGNVPIIPGIERMQILYGEDSTKKGTVSRYVRAGSVSDMNDVRSLMISVVARTPNAVAAQKATRIFNHFGATYAPSDTAPTGDAGSVFTAPADGRIRQQSSTTIALRNVCPT